MNYFLDSNICIYHLNDSAPGVSERLEQLPVKAIKIPSLVAAELMYGAEKSTKREYSIKVIKTFLSLYEIVSFDEKAAGHYATIRAELERKGKTIGGNDIIIAATVLANAGILVTHNTGEFSRVSQLIVEDWI